MAQMVFVPLSGPAARELRDSGTLTGPLAGHAATPALMRAHGYDADALEDAEFAALSYAAIHAVTLDIGDPLRLVIAAELGADRIAADPADTYGEVGVGELRWADVRALFVDDPVARSAVAAARPAARGQTVTDALEHDPVATLLDEHDLLWFAPEELDQLT